MPPVTPAMCAWLLPGYRDSLVYELEDDLTAICRYYLGDPEKLAKATASVAGQLEKKR